MNILELVAHKNCLEEAIKKSKNNKFKDFSIKEEAVLTNLTEGEINYIINHNPSNIPYDRLSFDSL